jgi:TniQ protein
MVMPGRVRRLPITLHPVPDELLESYLGRLAWAHGISYLMLLQHLGFPTTTSKDFLASRLTAMELARLAEATGSNERQIVALAVTPATTTAVTQAGWPSIATHEWRSHPERARGRQHTWACPACLQASGGAVLRPWVTGHLFVCPQHRCLLLGRCPSCRTFLSVPQQPCQQDVRHRCVDAVARAGPILVDDPDMRSAQVTYLSTVTSDLWLVRAGCSLEPFLETILGEKLGQPIMARLQRRAVGLGHHELPERGPAYLSIIAPELLTLARTIREPTVVSPWQLVVEMVQSLGATTVRLIQPWQADNLQATTTNILQSWWGSDGHRAWRAQQYGDAWLRSSARRRLSHFR